MTTGYEDTVTFDRFVSFQVKILVGDYVKFLPDSVQPSRNVGIGIERPSPRLRSEIEDRPMS